MPPEPSTFLGLLGIYKSKLTYNVLQMKLLTCTTMLAQRPRSNAFESGQGSFRGLYPYSGDVCSVLLSPAAAEIDVQCAETRGQALEWKETKLGFQPYGEMGVFKSCTAPSQF